MHFLFSHRSVRRASVPVGRGRSPNGLQPGAVGVGFHTDAPGSAASGGTRPPDGFLPRRDARIRPTAASHRRAFTLLELLAVITIIALLTGLALGGGHRANEAGRVARAKVELALLAAALADYHRIHGDFPQTSDGARLLQSLIGQRDPLNAPVTTRSLIELAHFTTAESRDPFADESAVLIDPWGRPYRYAYKSEASWSNSGYILYSVGPDGCDSAALLTGGFADPTPPENADNIYANR